MEKIIFNKLDEFIYKEVLSNGVTVYLYPTKKTKNFYMSISVKYGSSVCEYSLDGGKSYKRLKSGIAHFLEHKIGDLKKVEKLGFHFNALTSRDITNYNLSGSKNCLKAIKILLGEFYNIKINNKGVEKEKGIIREEYNSRLSNPLYRIDVQEYKNVLKNSFLNTPILGSKEDIESITSEDLLDVYKTFYNTNNTFIIITGNFDEVEILKEITKFMSGIKKSKEINITLPKVKESDNVVVPYMEMNEDISTPMVILTFKINQKLINPKHKRLETFYLNFIFIILFGRTSDIYKRYKNKGLFTKITSNWVRSENHYIYSICASTNKPDELINEFKKDLKGIKADLKTFERKKKVVISGQVEKFDDIEDVESMIVSDIKLYNKVVNNIYDMLYDVNYKEFTKIFNGIDFNNYSILKVIPKE